VGGVAFSLVGIMNKRIKFWTLGVRILRKSTTWEEHDPDPDDPVHIALCLTWFISAGIATKPFHKPYLWHYDGSPMVEIHLFWFRVTFGEGVDEWDLEGF